MVAKILLFSYVKLLSADFMNKFDYLFLCLVRAFNHFSHVKIGIAC